MGQVGLQTTGRPLDFIVSAEALTRWFSVREERDLISICENLLGAEWVGIVG